MVNVVPSNTPKIIVFNGPPRSGKDTAVEAVMNDELLVDFAPMHLKFAEPLKRAVHALIGQPDAELEQFSEVKDSYVDDFFGFTLGLVAIKRIEKFMTGLDLNSFQAGGTPKVPLVLVSDCGFKEELLPLARCFGTSNILMVHVHRDGCTFQNDSRSYVKSGDIETVQVISGERAAYQDQIRLIVRSWLEGHGLFKLTQVETE